VNVRMRQNWLLVLDSDLMFLRLTRSSCAVWPPRAADVYIPSACADQIEGDAHDVRNTLIASRRFRLASQSGGALPVSASQRYRVSRLLLRHVPLRSRSPKLAGGLLEMGRGASAFERLARGLAASCFRTRAYAMGNKTAGVA